MQISKNAVVSIHYTLKNDAGSVVDSSIGKDPLYYLHGAGNLIVGMEENLEGKQKGDNFQVVIPPEKGYGTVNPALKQVVSKSVFGKDQDIKVGMQFQAQNGNQAFIVTVKEINGDEVTIDGNHELAGENLHFSVEIMSVREASKEEIDHGHVHGPGGHHH